MKAKLKKQRQYEQRRINQAYREAGLGITPNVSGLYAVRILTTKL